MQIETALITYLRAQSALMTLVGNRINFIRALQSWQGTNPYIVFQKIDRPGLHSQDGSDNVAYPRFQFSIFADTYGKIKPIALALKTALDGYKGTMGGTGGVVVQGAFYENETDLDPGESGLYGVACDYIIWHGAES
jgi:hypothetical protein